MQLRGSKTDSFLCSAHRCWMKWNWKIIGTHSDQVLKCCWSESSQMNTSVSLNPTSRYFKSKTKNFFDVISYFYFCFFNNSFLISGQLPKSTIIYTKKNCIRAGRRKYCNKFLIIQQQKIICNYDRILFSNNFYIESTFFLPFFVFL